MKISFIAILIMLPTLSMAKGTKVTAERAATLVRQASVEKCLAVVENNRRGSAEFESIVELGTKNDSSSSTTVYKLKGYNLSGDVASGSWEITVTERSAEEGRSSVCNITKNEE